MPELPEVQTVVDTLALRILNRTITQVQVRWPKILGNDETDAFRTHLIGKRITGLDRRGKYIVIHLSTGTLIVHLRMEGRFYLKDPAQALDKHTHVSLLLDDEIRMDYNDTRKFGRFYYYAAPPYSVLAVLGPEPFDASMTAAYLYSLSRKKKQALKTFLLDQSHIAGIGNIYADEICFKVGLSPKQAVQRISQKKWEEIRLAAIAILRAAIAAGGTTVRSYTSSLGVSGRFQIQLHAYGRAGLPCERCGTLMRRIVVGQRGTVYCPHCQKVR